METPMEIKQLDIFQCHIRENNSESEQNLYGRRKHFSQKCKDLFNLLYAGEKITVYNALVKYKISSLPRRCLDLKECGVLITDEWNGPIKVWFFTDEQKKLNQRFYESCN